MECNKKLDMKGNKMEESHTTELENQIRTLNRIVIEGNGVQPLTVRVSTLENKINLILTGIGLIMGGLITDIVTHINWANVLR
jgi:hypothetical protein